MERCPYDNVVWRAMIGTLSNRMESSRKRRKKMNNILVSGLLRNDTPETRHQVLAFLDPVRALHEPVSIGLFAGKLDYSTIEGLDRSIAEAVSSAEGDWRNWEAIGEWAHNLQSVLAHA